MPDLFALLIAIDNYFELPLPDGTYYPKLGGCVRDVNHVYACLLYTSDAADERLRVDLGGRRIIKKKNAH